MCRDEYPDYPDYPVSPQHLYPSEFSRNACASMIIIEVTNGGCERGMIACGTHSPENVHIAPKWCSAINLTTKMHQEHIVMVGKAMTKLMKNCTALELILFNLDEKVKVVLSYPWK